MSEVLEKALYSAADLVAKTEGKEKVEKILSDKEKEIVAVVLEAQQNTFIKKIAEQWDKFSEEDKMRLYEK
jgi:predicted transposase YbfD/YdcC